MQSQLKAGHLAKVWPGIYSRGEPDLWTRLRGLDLRAGETVSICLSTAAQMYEFDTEDVGDLHVINPVGHLLRNSDGLVLHRRDGAPLTMVNRRPATAPNWTAVEVARALERPRALATLDAALRSGTCDRHGLLAAAELQKARRGIVDVRELIPLADGKAESPMESEARLVMHDGGLPEPILQHWITDLDLRSWRVDFAWPEKRLAVEYDGFEWHKDRDDFRRDRQKRAALEEMNWTMISIVSDDVRRRPLQMVRHIGSKLAL